MIRHKFREEKSSLGKLFRSVAKVILERDSSAVGMPMYIDSGAEVSMIPFRFGRALGFKQEDNDVIRELKGAGGASVPYILKSVILVLNGKRLNMRIAWALVEEVPIVMGRMDTFNKYRVIFDEREGWIDFEE